MLDLKYIDLNLIFLFLSTRWGCRIMIMRLYEKVVAFALSHQLENSLLADYMLVYRASKTPAFASHCGVVQFLSTLGSGM